MLISSGGNLYPIALEGALKLKEISYIHAEGYAAGELKHGPIALIDDGIPVVVLSSSDELNEKTQSNAAEVVARGARLIEVGCKVAADQLKLPSAPNLLGLSSCCRCADDFLFCGTSQGD